MPVRSSQTSVVKTVAGRGVTMVTLLSAAVPRMVIVRFPVTVNCGSTTNLFPGAWLDPPNSAIAK